MEEQEAAHSLPEALVEKVIAMIPFPSIFKARSLSKSWLARLSSTSSLKGAEKSLATSFQKQVGEWSSKWETFSPVLVTTEDFMAYNQASQSWSKLPLSSFLPEEDWSVRNLCFQIEGPLLYGFGPQTTDTGVMVVINILTRCCRQLPPRPDVLVTSLVCDKLVIYPDFEKYKMILLCEQKGFPDHYCAQVYDSKSDAWSSSESFVVSTDYAKGLTIAACLNGVLYMVGYKTPESLLAFKVEEGTLKELRLSSSVDGVVLAATRWDIVVCNDELLMIVRTVSDDVNRYVETIQVFRIDLGSLRLLRLAQGPPPALNLVAILSDAPVGHGNRIFFQMGEPGSRVLAYNVDEDVWGCFSVPTSTCTAERTYDWLESSFQPGFSPFMAV